ncbi:MAG: cyclase family protein, partial [Acidobacteriota bacterium]|nr:cyclase family protein [Acidobacteriota bacterium]
MRLNRKLGAILVSAAALAGACIFTQAQTPIGDKWWPSRWGAEDQRGAANLMTPERALNAARLIQKGQVYQLGRIYEHGMPLPGKRHFSLTIPGSPSSGPSGKNRIVS